VSSRSEEDESLGSLSSRINWYNSAPFAELGGIFPVTPGVRYEQKEANFSTCSLDMVRYHK
jgi:hypothetical protein